MKKSFDINALIASAEEAMELNPGMSLKEAIVSGYLCMDQFEEYATESYEDYQLRWMIEHGHSLKELVIAMASIASHEIEASADYPSGYVVEDAFKVFCKQGFGGDKWDDEEEFDKNENRRHMINFFQQKLKEELASKYLSEDIIALIDHGYSAYDLHHIAEKAYELSLTDEDHPYTVLMKAIRCFLEEVA